MNAIQPLTAVPAMPYASPAIQAQVPNAFPDPSDDAYIPRFVQFPSPVTLPLPSLSANSPNDLLPSPSTSLQYLSPAPALSSLLSIPASTPANSAIYPFALLATSPCSSKGQSSNVVATVLILLTSTFPFGSRFEALRLYRLSSKLRHMSSREFQRLRDVSDVTPCGDAVSCMRSVSATMCSKSMDCSQRCEI